MANPSASMQRASLHSGESNIIIVSNRGNTEWSAALRCGQTVLASSIRVTQDRTAVSCPGNWFDWAGLRTASSMTVGVTLTQTFPIVESDPPTLSTSFVLYAGSDIAPAIESKSLTPVPVASAADFTGIYISGYTRCRIKVHTEHIGAVAHTSSVTARFPDGQVLSLGQDGDYTEEYTTHWLGTTAAPLGMGGTVSITATDERGLSTQSTETVSVLSYRAPMIQIQALTRCDANGDEDEGGAYFKIKAAADIYTNNLSGNTVRSFKAGIEGGTMTDIVSGTESVIGGLTNAEQAYKIVLELRDRVSEAVTRSAILQGRRHDLMLIRTQDGTQMGVGIAPADPQSQRVKSTVQLPSGGEYRVGGRSVLHFPGNTYDSVVSVSDTRLGGDVLKVDFEDRYAACNEAVSLSLTGNASSWANIPAAFNQAGWSFEGHRTVLFSGPTNVFVILIEYNPVPGRIWVQHGKLAYGAVTWETKWRYHTPLSES